MHPMTSRVGAALVAAIWTLPVLAGEALTIADLAPKESVVVIGVDDSKGMFEAFDRTGLAGLWKDPEFKKWFDKQSKEAMDELSTDLDKLGVKVEDFKRPSGPMGLASWLAAKPLDEETGEPLPAGVLLMADYGDEADAMHETITTLLEKGAQQKDLELNESEHEGVTIYTYAFVESEEPDPDAEEDDMGVEEAPPLLSYKEMHYTRADGVLLISSDMERLHDSIDRVKGAKGEGVDANPSFQTTRRLLDQAHGYAVLLAGPGRQWLKALAEGEGDMGDPMQGMMMGALAPLGIENIQSIASGFRFDTDDAMLEQSYAVVAPKKEGLLELVEAKPVKFEPPAFVGAGAAQLTSMQANFPGLLPLVEKVVKGLPEDMRGMVEGQLMMVQQMMGPMFANLGPDMHIVSGYQRPLGPSSETSTVALKIRDAEAFTTALQGFIPMLGLAPRDFNGNQIYAPQPGGMVPEDAIAIGIGFGYAIIGTPQSVEDMMRDAGAQDAAKLSDDKNFKNASRHLSGEGFAYSYSNMKETLDWGEWYVKNIDKMIEAQFAETFGDEEPADEQEREWRKEALEEAKRGVPAFLRDNPPVGLLRKYVGDSVTEVRSVGEGFVGTTYLLAPG